MELKETMTIFLGSSIVDPSLKEDRLAVGSCLNEKNAELLKEGRYVRLVKCESEDHFLVRGGKQKELNDKLLSSDAALFMANGRLGAYTEEEMEAAEEKLPLYLAYRGTNPYEGRGGAHPYGNEKELLSFLKEIVDKTPWRKVPDQKGEINVYTFVYCSSEGSPEGEEYRQMAEYLRARNDEFVHQGGFFRLLDAAAFALGKELSAALAGSKLALFLFDSSIGDRAMACLREAIADYEAAGSPRILTYLKDGAADEKTKSFLAESVRHYWCAYSTVNDVLLSLSEHIGRLAIGVEHPRIEGQDVTFMGMSLGPAASFSVLAHSRLIAEKREDLSSLAPGSQEYALRAKELLELQGEVLSSYLGLASKLYFGSSASGVTAAAANLYAEGRYEEVAALLDGKKLASLAAKSLEILDVTGKETGEIAAQLSLLNAALVELPYDPKRDKEIEERFLLLEKLIKGNAALSPAPLRSHARFLASNGRLSEAIEKAEEFVKESSLRRASLPKAEAAAFFAYYGFLRLVAASKEKADDDVFSFDEGTITENYLRKASDLYMGLAKEDPARYGSEALNSLLYLGNYYRQEGEGKEGEAYARAVRLGEALLARGFESVRTGYIMALIQDGYYEVESGDPDKGEKLAAKGLGLLEKELAKGRKEEAAELSFLLFSASAFLREAGREKEAKPLENLSHLYLRRHLDPARKEEALPYAALAIMISQDNLTRFLENQTSVDLAETSDLLLDALELLDPYLDSDRAAGLSSLALASALIIVSSIRKEAANLLKGVEILGKTSADPAVSLGYEKRLALGNAYIQAASGLFRTGLKKEEALAFFRRGVAYLSPIEEQNPETIVPLLGSAYLSAWSVALQSEDLEEEAEALIGEGRPYVKRLLEEHPEMAGGENTAASLLSYLEAGEEGKGDEIDDDDVEATVSSSILTFIEKGQEYAKEERYVEAEGAFAAAVAAGESLGKAADPEERGNTLVARYCQALSAAFLDSEDTHVLYHRAIEAFEEEGKHDDNPEFASFGILFAKLLAYLFVIGEEDEARRFVKEFDVLMAAREISGLDPEGTFSLWLEAAEQELVENEMEEEARELRSFQLEKRS